MEAFPAQNLDKLQAVQVQVLHKQEVPLGGDQVLDLGALLVLNIV
mgnify:CR=1 FL=1